MLAYATGEYQRIDPSKRCDQRSYLPYYPVHKQVNRLASSWLVRSTQAPHVRGDTRDAEQPRPAIDQILDQSRVHTVLLHEIQYDAGIQRAAACSHHQTIDRSETHRAGNAAPSLDR